MTIEVSDLRTKLREAADAAAAEARRVRAGGNNSEGDFQSGRQAAFLTAMHFVSELEEEQLEERDANIADEQLGEEAARLGLIGYGQGVNLGAVERLEEFARQAGGAVDMASGTVYSDADEGL